MKLFIFLFAGFLSTAFITKAQDDVYDTPPPIRHKKNISEKEKNNYPRKIKTGFVFIDGKYIDAPYKVKQKEPGKIYINNILVENRLKMTNTVLNPYKIDTLPPIPKSITKNTTFKELYKTKYNNTKLLVAISNFYDLHYPSKEARKKIIEYYRKIPCVKSFDGYTLELYDGEKQPICIDDVFHVEIYKNFGIYSNRKLPTKEEIYKREESHVKDIKNSLLDNNVCIFIKYKTPENKNKIGLMLEISSMRAAKIGINTALKERACPIVEINSKVKKRLEKLREKYIKEGIFKPEDLKKNKTKKSGYIIPSVKSTGNIAFFPLPQVSSFVVNKKIISLLL